MVDPATATTETAARGSEVMVGACLFVVHAVHERANVLDTIIMRKTRDMEPIEKRHCLRDIIVDASCWRFEAERSKKSKKNRVITRVHTFCESNAHASSHARTNSQVTSVRPSGEQEKTADKNVRRNHGYATVHLTTVKLHYVPTSWGLCSLSPHWKDTKIYKDTYVTGNAIMSC
jgi:hypothetical protein